MNYKHLFSNSLSALGDTIHFAAHSHHLWPDAAQSGQMQAYSDAARLADDKWDHIFSDVYPKAQAYVAQELNLPDPSTLVFAPNTHNLLVALFSAIPTRPLRILTSDGEFHSLRRQLERFEESGAVICDRVPVEPASTYTLRFIEAANANKYDFIWTSHVFFNSGHSCGPLESLADLASPGGPHVVVDGYHSFMAFPVDLSRVADRLVFISGGYKYAMAGEGCTFMHVPHGILQRPEITGWYAAFGALAQKSKGVAYAGDAGRFFGATFDPSGLYRFNAVQDMLAEHGLTTAKINAHIHPLKRKLVQAIESGDAGRLNRAAIINDHSGPHTARFIALRHDEAQEWKAALHAQNIITDVRADVLRIGLGLYHDAADIEAFCAAARKGIS